MKRQRHKKAAVVDAHLVALFAKAIPAQEAAWWDACHDKRRMTLQQHREVSAAIHAFERAAGIMPWDRSRLSLTTLGRCKMNFLLLSLRTI
jgi:hypothetical protein